MLVKKEGDHRESRVPRVSMTAEVVLSEASTLESDDHY